MTGSVLLRGGPCSLPLTSHSIRNYSLDDNCSFGFCSRTFFFDVFMRIMASRRTCTTAFRRSEAFLSQKSGSSSSSSIQKFSRQSSNWTCPAPQQSNGVKQTSLNSYRKFIATPSSTLRIQRPFSSSPASRHGHLDTPAPGEESVTHSLNHYVVLI